MCFLASRKQSLMTALLCLVSVSKEQAPRVAWSAKGWLKQLPPQPRSFWGTVSVMETKPGVLMKRNICSSNKCLWKITGPPSSWSQNRSPVNIMEPSDIHYLNPNPKCCLIPFLFAYSIHAYCVLPLIWINRDFTL